MKIALVAGTHLGDPTYGRVCAGLVRAFRRRGHQARAFGPQDARELLRFTPDVVHAHFAGHLTETARSLLLRTVGRGARLILTFQDLNYPGSPRLSPKRARRIAELVRAAHRVTALTSELGRKTHRAYPEAAGKFTVVGNGVDPEWFALTRAGRGGIAAAARLSPYKGIDLLLWAFRGFLNQTPAARLTICGRDFSDGHYQRFARRLGLSDRVRFLGGVGARRLREVFSRSRFFVCASRGETYGIALLEAMARGRAVLASRTGVARGFTHGRQAWLVPPGDWRALEKGMLRLWQDASLRRRLAETGQHTAAKNTWDDRARRYERLYRCC